MTSKEIGNGIMPKLMAKLFPGMFKKQSQKWMDQFKEFVEKRGDNKIIGDR